MQVKHTNNEGEKISIFFHIQKILSIVNLIVEKYLNLKQSIEVNLHVLQVIHEKKIIQEVIVKKVDYYTVKSRQFIQYEVCR